MTTENMCEACGLPLYYCVAFGVWSCENKLCEGYGMTVDFE